MMDIQINGTTYLPYETILVFTLNEKWTFKLVTTRDRGEIQLYHYAIPRQLYFSFDFYMQNLRLDRRIIHHYVTILTAFAAYIMLVSNKVHEMYPLDFQMIDKLQSDNTVVDTMFCIYDDIMWIMEINGIYKTLLYILEIPFNDESIPDLVCIPHHCKGLEDHKDTSIEFTHLESFAKMHQSTDECSMNEYSIQDTSNTDESSEIADKILEEIYERSSRFIKSAR